MWKYDTTTAGSAIGLTSFKNAYNTLQTGASIEAGVGAVRFRVNAALPTCAGPGTNGIIYVTTPVSIANGMQVAVTGCDGTNTTSAYTLNSTWEGGV